MRALLWLPAIRRRWAPRPLVVLAGPGANGGDGWLIARLLADAGWPVRIALLGDRERLKGDTPHHSSTMDCGRGGSLSQRPERRRTHRRRPLWRWSRPSARGRGPGLGRRDGGPFGAPLSLVDLPSGVNGDTGQVLGAAAQAHLTVTFFRQKPGHLLAPGRFLCGEIITADIGVPESAASSVQTFQNTPALWPAAAHGPDPSGHKYTRGHALIAGGAETTGAARLTARAALRSGAGLATIAAPRRAWPVYAAAELAVMVRPIDDVAGYTALLEDKRFSALTLGPGLGLDAPARGLVEAAGATGRQLVLDADALTLFADTPEVLFEMTRAAPAAVLTPHMGEFQRLFGDVAGSKLDQARAAAVLSGAVMVLKGPDTVIAAPDGRAAINAHAPPTLATAGSGDVLAGIITGLLASGASAFDAACAGVWLHGEAAYQFGPGLIASDLLDTLPVALSAAALK